MPSRLGDDLIGHATIVRLLTSWLDDPAPAYLCIGAQHLGKRTVAERFVRLLLGLAIDDPHWRSHPDLVVFEPEEGKTLVSVEQVRDARARLSLRPMRAPRVVAYLPVADRLNESGTNALLKVLEEPPAGAVFVLVAEDPSRIPGTLKSRCISLPFQLVPVEEIVSGLVARGMSKDEARDRAIAAHGKPGLALEPLEAGESPGTKFVQDFFQVSSTGARLAAVERLVASCDSAADSGIAWREALQSATEAARMSFSQDPYRTTLFGLSILTAMRAIGGAFSPRLALDVCAVRFGSSVEAQLPQLFPTPLPSSLALMYTTPIV